MSKALELATELEKLADMRIPLAGRSVTIALCYSAMELRRLAEIERKYNEIMAQELGCLETIAKQASQEFTSWKGWDAEDDDSIKTPSGNSAGDEREYWRDVVKFVTNMALKKD